MECTVRDVNIHYEEYGQGKPILILHGWTLDHRYMVHNMEPLFKERTGWRRIYPDFPGMGKSEAPEWLTRHDQFLEIVMEFIDQVAPDQRLTVAGLSFGGYIARGLIHHRGEQIDGVMLAVPLVEKNREKLVLPEHRVDWRDPDFLAQLLPEEELQKEVLVQQTIPVLKEVQETISPAVRVANQNFLNKVDWAFSFDPDDLARPFEGPSLIITGRQDHWCGYHNAYQLLDRYPRATFAALDSAGHNLPIEQKIIFQALANEWLDRLEREAGSHQK